MAYRNRVAPSAPTLVSSVVDTTNAKRNGSILTLQNRMETTSQWLDDAITNAKRKIVEGTSVPIQDVKKAKTISFKRADGAPLSPVQDKENSPNAVGSPGMGEDRVRIKPPPSAVKRKVNGMRVVDLKKELKSKGIETKGLKKDLQQRLLSAYTTVEKIMSPQKAPPKRNTASEEAEKEQSAPDSAEGQHPDTASVQSEVIVFSSSVDEQDKQANSKPAFPAKSSLIRENATQKEVEQGEQTVEDAPMKEVKTVAVENAQPEVEGGAAETSIESMEVESPEEECGAVEKDKRHSMMDCTESGENATEKERSHPKVTLSVDSLTKSQHKDTEVNEPGPNQEEQMKQKVGAGSSRKISQDSQQSASSNKSSGSGAKEVTHNHPGKESEEEINQSKPKSPIRRVQAAIQMFTAKSASKPANKPMATPSKLQWLSKSHQQQNPQKTTTNTDAPMPPQQEASKVQNASEAQPKPTSEAQPKPASEAQPKPEKLTAKAIRRPGLQQAVGSVASTSSALKTNRFLTKANQNTATADARKARIAEMREKSKPVAKPVFATTKDFSAATSTLSAMKNKAGVVLEDKDNKRKLLTAQMREKAAARKQMEMAAKQAHQPEPGKQMEIAAKQANQAAEPSKQQVQKEALKEEPMAPQAPVEQCAQPMSAAKPKTPSTAQGEDHFSELRPQLLSPMDTYEISDREDSESESESESEDEDESRPRKKIPEWAHRGNLLPALEKQFADMPNRIDPDEIFCEVQTCDLQAIFNSKRTRYLRRTSSGNWSKDRVTPVEKLTYKRAMGYGKKNAMKA